jgi:hypothetical protein
VQLKTFGVVGRTDHIRRCFNGGQLLVNGTSGRSRNAPASSGGVTGFLEYLIILYNVKLRTDIDIIIYAIMMLITKTNSCQNDRGLTLILEENMRLHTI